MECPSPLIESWANVHAGFRNRQPRAEDVVSFGPEAGRWGARLTGKSPCVLSDASESAEALEEATHRRRLGHVLTGPVLDEARTVVARRLSPLILERAGGDDQRRTMFDALTSGSLEVDGIAQNRQLPVDDHVKQTLRDLYLIGSATIVRSRQQAAYLGEFFGRYRPGYFVAPGIDPNVPVPAPRVRGDAIVIWAPHTDVSDLSIYLFALADIKAPIVVIGIGQAKAFPNIRVVSLAYAQRELSQAALLIDGTVSDPSSAIALAAWKIPLVAARSSGADEFLDNVRLYDPWNWRSILGAVSAARADEAPMVMDNAKEAFDSVAQGTVLSSSRRGALVTIIVPTFDRASVLPMALESLQSQSYEDIEILVVNDGGPSVDHVVSRYSRARCISNTVNCGFFTSCNNGIANARGEYIGFLADDDIYYFDHVERLVAALERSRAMVAHANALTRFLELDSRGILQTSGNQVMFGNHLDVTGALWAGYLGSNLVRKEVFDKIGKFSTTNAVADYEMFVRLSRSYDFIHVDQVTFEWRYRTDGSTLTHNVGTAKIVDGLAEVFERYPSNGDARVEAGRVATLAFIRERSGLPYWMPPIRLDVNGQH